MTGFRRDYLPAVQPGSSIMPGKVNPVMANAVDGLLPVIGNARRSPGLPPRAARAERDDAGDRPIGARKPDDPDEHDRAFAEFCVTGIEPTERARI